MIVRTSKKTVTFANAFVLGDFDEVFPPGIYDVETDEELLQGLSFQAYRRLRSLVYLPAKPGRGGPSRTLTIDPDALDAAMKRAGGSRTPLLERKPVQKPSKQTRKPREVETDRKAVDRAEDEGMTLHPH